MNELTFAPPKPGDLAPAEAFAARVLHDRLAQRWMSAAERYGAKSEVTSVLKSEVLLLFAPPSIPADVRDEIEARATAGEKITPLTPSPVPCQKEHAR